MSGDLLSDGTLSLNGSIQSKSQDTKASHKSHSFVTTSSISGGSSTGSPSYSMSCSISTSIKSESAREFADSGSPATTGGFEDASHSQHSRERSGGTTAPGTIKSSRSATYTSGYTRTTEHNSPRTLTDASDREHTAEQSSAVDSAICLDPSLHSDRSATDYRYQTGTDTHGHTSSGGYDLLI